MSRVLAIACGRHDPLMKLAVGRCPESHGQPLALQSTISGLENAPRKAIASDIRPRISSPIRSCRFLHQEQGLGVRLPLCRAMIEAHATPSGWNTNSFGTALSLRCRCPILTSQE
jgi:hypothetical protein